MTLDELTAVKVMGWTKGDRTRLHAAEGRTFYDGSFKHKWEDDAGPTSTYWSPTTNIAHAWEVVERMKDGGFKVTMGCSHKEACHNCASMCSQLADFRSGYADQVSMPIAITLAALRACGVTEGEIEEAQR